MKISIRQPLSYTHQGKKDNQEDRIYPAEPDVTSRNHFFILCDGMGGHENGEVASSTVCEALGDFFTTHQPENGIATEEFFNQAVANAYNALDKKDTGAVRKMGTTLACIYLHRKGCLAAHIGDSRIYQIRPGKGLIYQSSDHSLVNELLKIGEITPEEALNYPQKNVITRAMQPNQERRCKAEIHQLTDIQSGDYFFLCCDGVLEQLTNDKLYSILSDKNRSDKEKLKAIEAVGKDVTKDNYTAYLIPVDKVILEDPDEKQEDEDVVIATMDVVIATMEEGKKEHEEQQNKVELLPSSSPDKQKRINKWKIGIGIGIGIVLIILIILAAALWLIINTFQIA